MLLVKYSGACLLAALFFGTIATVANAVEAPYYRVKGSRLGAGFGEFTRIAGENQILTNPTTKIKVTCGVMISSPLTEIKGSAAGSPSTSKAILEYSKCAVAENGAKCHLGKSGIITDKFTTETLKDELAFGSKSTAKGTKLVDFFTPAIGSVFAKLEFVAGAGGECKNKATNVEGSVVVEILNSTKEAVNVEEREAEEEFGFIRAVAGGEACTFAGVCTKGGLKAFGTGTTYEGIAEDEIGLFVRFGVFSK